eukprot:2407529-Prymnesium_polylepis.1
MLTHEHNLRNLVVLAEPDGVLQTPEVCDDLIDHQRCRLAGCKFCSRVSCGDPVAPLRRGAHPGRVHRQGAHVEVAMALQLRRKAFAQAVRGEGGAREARRVHRRLRARVERPFLAGFKRAGVAERVVPRSDPGTPLEVVHARLGVSRSHAAQDERRGQLRLDARAGLGAAHHVFESRCAPVDEHAGRRHVLRRPAHRIHRVHRDAQRLICLEGGGRLEHMEVL